MDIQCYIYIYILLYYLYRIVCVLLGEHLSSQKGVTRESSGCALENRLGGQELLRHTIPFAQATWTFPFQAIS